MDSNIKLNELLAALKAEIQDWVETRTKLLQLHVFEKTAIVGSFLVYGIIIINVLFFAFLFAFFALGFLIGKWVNSVAGGFAIISCFFLLILIVMLIFRKAIFTGLQNLLLKELNTEPENESSVSKG
jgi:amino acid transporter